MSSFDETKHPRDKDGKFIDGNGGSKSESEKRAELVKKYSSEPEIERIRKERIIRHLRKRIDEHKDKIKNPEKYIEDWYDRPDVYKKGILKYWKKEIINYYNQINKLR
jgi:hypothetical protein